MLRTSLPEIKTATLPGPKAKAIIDRRAASVPNAIRCVYPVVIARGEGAMLEDVDGNRFLDWVGGVGVLNIGYTQPEIVEAVKTQADNYFHGMFNIVTHEGYVELAEKLASIAPVLGDKKKVFFANSGAEADENAVKVARGYTKRPNVIVFTGAFHGRTNLTMAMTTKSMPYKQGFGAKYVAWVGQMDLIVKPLAAKLTYAIMNRRKTGQIVAPEKKDEAQQTEAK